MYYYKNISYFAATVKEFYVYVVSKGKANLPCPLWLYKRLDFRYADFFC
jgi:hypothetical protein